MLLPKTQSFLPLFLDTLGSKGELREGLEGAASGYVEKFLNMREKAVNKICKLVMRHEKDESGKRKRVPRIDSESAKKLYEWPDLMDELEKLKILPQNDDDEKEKKNKSARSRPIHIWGINVHKKGYWKLPSKKAATFSELRKQLGFLERELIDKREALKEEMKEEMEIIKAREKVEKKLERLEELEGIQLDLDDVKFELSEAK